MRVQSGRFPCGPFSPVTRLRPSRKDTKQTNSTPPHPQTRPAVMHNKPSYENENRKTTRSLPPQRRQIPRTHHPRRQTPPLLQQPPPRPLFGDNPRQPRIPRIPPIPSRIHLRRAQPSTRPHDRSRHPRYPFLRANRSPRPPASLPPRRIPHPTDRPSLPPPRRRIRHPQRHPPLRITLRTSLPPRHRTPRPPPVRKPVRLPKTQKNKICKTNPATHCKQSNPHPNQNPAEPTRTQQNPGNPSKPGHSPGKPRPNPPTHRPAASPKTPIRYTDESTERVRPRR
jgi:hypothetical protein